MLPPLAAPAAAQGPAAGEVREIEYNPHRVHIRLADLELHGFTAGCRRCGLMRNGLPALGVKHLDACRTRVEQAMRDAAHPRLQRAEGRAQDEVERRAHAAAAGEHRAAAGPAEGRMGAAPRGAPSEGPGVDGGVLVPARPVAPAAVDDDDDAWRQLLGPAAAPATPIARANDMHDDSEDDGMMMWVGPAAVVELYSPPRVTAGMPRRGVSSSAATRGVSSSAASPGGLVAGPTFDLHAGVNGARWDFTKPLDRKRAFDQIRAEEPFLVVGSPPCTMFSSLQNTNKRKGTAEWKDRRRTAEVLLTFAAAVYKMQVLAGRHFLHEHPAGATSWSHPSMTRLLATSGVGAVVAHQCAYGLQSSTPGGGRAPAKKPTRFMSSAPALLEALSRRCPGGHPHAPLVGGTRARDAATYPPGLCEAISQGASEQLRRDKRACGVRALRAWRDARGLHAVRAAGTSPDRVLRGPLVPRRSGGEVTADAAQKHTQDEEAQLAAWAGPDRVLCGPLVPHRSGERSSTRSPAPRFRRNSSDKHARKNFSSCATGASGSSRASPSAGAKPARLPLAVSGWT